MYTEKVYCSLDITNQLLRKEEEANQESWFRKAKRVVVGAIRGGWEYNLSIMNFTILISNVDVNKQLNDFTTFIMIELNKLALQVSELLVDELEIFRMDKLDWVIFYVIIFHLMVPSKNEISFDCPACKESKHWLLLEQCCENTFCANYAKWYPPLFSPSPYTRAKHPFLYETGYDVKSKAFIDTFLGGFGKYLLGRGFGEVYGNYDPAHTHRLIRFHWFINPFVCLIFIYNAYLPKKCYCPRDHNNKRVNFLKFYVFFTSLVDKTGKVIYSWRAGDPFIKRVGPGQFWPGHDVTLPDDWYKNNNLLKNSRVFYNEIQGVSDEKMDAADTWEEVIDIGEDCQYYVHSLKKKDIRAMDREIKGMSQNISLRQLLIRHWEELFSTPRPDLIGGKGMPTYPRSPRYVKSLCIMLRRKKNLYVKMHADSFEYHFNVVALRKRDDFDLLDVMPENKLKTLNTILKIVHAILKVIIDHFDPTK